MSIVENVKKVQKNIAEACNRSGRDPSEVTLVAVSKRKPVDDVIEGLEAGLQHFGENRVEESQEKIPAVTEQMAQLESLPQPIWHMVGHVQSRKAGDVIDLFPVIDSLDSVKLANRLNQIAGEKSRKPQVFIQVNIAGERQKYGFDAMNWQDDWHVRGKLFEDFTKVLQLPHLDVRGLMMMAPYGASQKELRGLFSSLSALKTAVETEFETSLPDLNMGMTDDYVIAIEEGATIVRVGRALFGEREY